MPKTKIYTLPTLTSKMPCSLCITLPICIADNDPDKIVRCKLVDDYLSNKMRHIHYNSSMVVMLEPFTQFRYILTKTRSIRNIAIMIIERNTSHGN